MSHYKPYPAYRESGVEWIGAVPEHWQHSKVAWDMKMTIGWTPPTGNRSYYGGLHNWVSIADLSAGRISETKQKITDAAVDEMHGSQAPAGSLLFSYKLSIGEVALLEVPAYTNEAIAAFHPCKRVYLPFWKYAAPVILPRYSRQNIYGSDLLNQELMNSARLLLPEADEQRTISEQLDRETIRIDSLIIKKTRFIELLKEKRQALITQAVTKGLNAEAPLRESGVDWFKEVPAHWSVQSIKQLVSIGNGSTPSKENTTYWENGIFPWLTSSCVNLEVVDSAEQFVTGTALRECHLPIITPPAVLVGITGQGKTRGMASTLMIEATINQHIAFLKPTSKRIRIEFLREFLNAAYEWLRFGSEGVGSTKGAITCEQLGNTKIALPPLSEQAVILDLIGRQTDRLDLLTSKTQRSIDLLKERRAAFITAAVTGQIDLRESV